MKNWVELGDEARASTVQLLETELLSSKYPILDNYFRNAINSEVVKITYYYDNARRIIMVINSHKL